MHTLVFNLKNSHPVMQHSFIRKHKKFEHGINYYFRKTSWISMKFGYLVKLENVMLRAEKCHLSCIDFTGKHQKLIYIIIYYACTILYSAKTSAYVIKVCRLTLRIKYSVWIWQGCVKNFILLLRLLIKIS